MAIPLLHSNQFIHAPAQLGRLVPTFPTPHVSIFDELESQSEHFRLEQLNSPLPQFANPNFVDNNPNVDRRRQEPTTPYIGPIQPPADLLIELHNNPLDLNA